MHGVREEEVEVGADRRGGPHLRREVLDDRRVARLRRGVPRADAEEARAALDEDAVLHLELQEDVRGVHAHEDRARPELAAAVLEVARVPLVELVVQVLAARAVRRHEDEQAAQRAEAADARLHLQEAEHHVGVQADQVEELHAAADGEHRLQPPEDGPRALGQLQRLVLAAVRGAGRLLPGAVEVVSAVHGRAAAAAAEQVLEDDVHDGRNHEGHVQRRVDLRPPAVLAGLVVVVVRHALRFCARSGAHRLPPRPPLPLRPPRPTGAARGQRVLKSTSDPPARVTAGARSHGIIGPS